MNNLQFIIKDNSRYAMHVAVELCEQGDFDSVTDAFKWLMQERDDSELGSGTCEFSPTTDNPPTCSNCGWQADAYDCDWLDGGTYEYNGRFCKNCGALVRKAVER